MLEPVPEYGTFQDRETPDHGLPPVARFPGGEEFPGSSESPPAQPAQSNASRGRRGRGNQSVQLAPGTADLDVVAAVGERENELLIEDTSAAARRVKGYVLLVHFSYQLKVWCDRVWSCLRT